MAKKKKKKSTGKRMSGLSPKALIMRKARSYPIYECRITNEGAEGGKFNIMVARTKPNGKLIVGIYLIDTWCMGLKDTFFRHDMYVDEFDDLVGRMGAQSFDEITCELCEPNHAFNLIYGAVEYAEDLGFKPPKDFQTTEYILADVDDVEYEEIEFGKDGMPFYIDGPDDNVAAILAKLDKNVGPGNYHYIMSISGFDDDRYDEQEEDWKDRFMPRAKMDAKIATLKTSIEKTTLMIQATIAIIIADLLDGEFSELGEAFGNDFREEIMEGLEDALEAMGMKEIIERAGGEVDSSFYQPLVQYVVGNAILTEGVDFLFEEDYDPLGFEPTDERSDKDFEALAQVMFTGLTIEEKISSLILTTLAGVVIKQFGEDFPEHLGGPPEQEKIILETIEELKETDFLSQFFDDEKDLIETCREELSVLLANWKESSAPFRQ